MAYFSNCSTLTDYYEFTMANGFFNAGLKDKVAVFDMFFRHVPDNGGFAIMAGVEQLVDFLKNFHFDESDVEFLRQKGVFSEGFLDYLRDFKFTGDVWAVPEGTPIFPKEPIVTVKAPIIEAVLAETMLLLCINHQSLIATKANRIARAAQGRAVMEFGARRAQGAEAAVYGARAAYIGGFCGSSNVLTDQLCGVPALGTMAHSWVQMFDSEYDAFCTYARQYPDNCALLVDTYNTLKSGIPNAIKCFDDVLKPMGKRPKSVRIDSGDITYLSKHARKMLDDAGYPDCQICASNALDEYLIRDMLIEGAKIDLFGVGERLITAQSDPVFGGVYKLAAIINEDGSVVPKVKFSDNVGKHTLPSFKKTYRLFDKETGKAMADVICLHDEKIDENAEYDLFDPEHTWKRKTVNNFIARELAVQIFKNGELCVELPDTEQIKKSCDAAVSTIWEEVQRFENPHTYYVDLSQKLWDQREEMLKIYSNLKK